jgi:hypothetical protein
MTIRDINVEVALCIQLVNVTPNKLTEAQACNHSWPWVSNYNGFSESQFKTQKSEPDYPGLAGFTPEQVYGSLSEDRKIKTTGFDKRYALLILLLSSYEP